MMKAIRSAMARTVGTFRPSDRERELAEELESHFQLHMDDNLRAGLTPDEARRQARLRFGPMEAVKEAYRDRHGVPILAHLAQDVRFAGRLLRKAPGLTVTVIATIAVAVGANAAMFSVFNAAALQPLHVPGGARLATISLRLTGRGHRNVHGAPSMLSVPEFRAVADHARSFDGVTAFAPFNPVTLGGAPPRQVLATLVSCEYFDVLSSRPQHGRGFAARDCRPGAPATVVLSDAIWRSVFNADPAAVGRSVLINRSPFIVIGVAPREFTGTQVVAEDVFVPLTAQAVIDRGRTPLEEDDMSWLLVIGRLRPGASLRSLAGELPVIAARITTSHHNGLTYRLDASRATLAGLPEIRSIVVGIGGVLLAGVGLVLLLACANIANLLLARSASRRREVSVRLALGASRGRLIQQLLTESLLLAAIGGALGAIAAAWIVPITTRGILAHLPPGSWPLVFDPRPDMRVFLYAFALTTLTGVAAGLAPALQSTRDLAIDLRESRGTDRRSMRRTQGALVTVQVAASMVLLLTAGLLARGLYHAQTIDPGFSMRDVAVLSYDLSGAGYAAPAAAAFQQRVHDRLTALPGVRGVAGTTAVPLSDQHSQSDFTVSDSHLSIEFAEVTPEMFDALGMTFVRGRTFTTAETLSGGAAIVSESSARRLWPGRDPIGQPVIFENVNRFIVGVTSDAQLSRLGRSDTPYLFVPAGRDAAMRMQMLVAEQPGAGVLDLAVLRDAVRSLDPQLVVEVQRLDDNLEVWRAPSRLVCAIAATLAGLALVLACTGLSGTVAYGVSRRAREIGIRMALGAAQQNVMRLVIRQGMLPVVTGSVVGVAAGAAVSTVLSSMLFGISPYDPLSYGVVSAALLIVAFGACWVPARRALAVDPTVALRSE